MFTEPYIKNSMPMGNQNVGCCIYITHKGLHIYLYACVHIYAFICPYIITFITFTFSGTNDLQIGLAINLLYLPFKGMLPNIIHKGMFSGTQSCSYSLPSPFPHCTLSHCGSGCWVG